jgi:hypothetical protein
MNKNVKGMIKNVIEENAVGFKKSTADALYEKINHKLKDQYVAVAKNIFSPNNTETKENK